MSKTEKELPLKKRDCVRARSMKYEKWREITVQRYPACMIYIARVLVVRLGGLASAHPISCTSSGKPEFILKTWDITWIYLMLIKYLPAEICCDKHSHEEKIETCYSITYMWTLRVWILTFCHFKAMNIESLRGVGMWKKREVCFTLTCLKTIG